MPKAGVFADGAGRVVAERIAARLADREPEISLPSVPLPAPASCKDGRRKSWITAPVPAYTREGSRAPS
jgi:hypothetical protein